MKDFFFKKKNVVFILTHIVVNLQKWLVCPAFLLNDKMNYPKALSKNSRSLEFV